MEVSELRKVDSVQMYGWNTDNKKEVDEAKGIYIKARNAGKRILDHDKKEVKLWTDLNEMMFIDEPLKDSEVFMRILDESGDSRVIWDSRDPKQVADAATLFEEYLKKGWRAYAVDQHGVQGKRIRRFNAATEEIFFDESELGTSLKEFVSAFRTIKVLPKTRPA